MMEHRIYILFTTSIILLSTGFPLFAQSNDKKKGEEIQYPFYNGLTVSADIYGLGSKMLGSDFLSSEISIDASLKNRFFPVFEAGFGTTNTSDSEKGITYKSSAPFFRVGLNYNTMKKRDDYFLYVGARYAFSSFTYDVTTFTTETGIESPTLIDNSYGGSIGYQNPGMKGNMHWLELVLGVRVTIYKNFKMGWTLRLKNELSASKSEYGDPWYVPGYGKYGSSRLGITYSLIYKLPF